MTFITHNLIDCNPRHSRRVSFRERNRGLKKENKKTKTNKQKNKSKNKKKKGKPKDIFPYYRLRKMTVFATF